jgi:LAO/AO transport system kinase
MMEIADILVVNKCDLPNADLVARQLIALYESAPAATDGWQPPVLRTAGALGEGIDALADALEQHHMHTQKKDVRGRHRLAQARHQVLALARQRVVDGMLSRPGATARLDALVAQVANRELDPHAAAEQLVRGA